MSIVGDTNDAWIDVLKVLGDGRTVKITTTFKGGTVTPRRWAGLCCSCASEHICNVGVSQNVFQK